MPPTGFKRSRALWDRTRLPHASKKEQWHSLWAALFYELQPFRLHAGWSEDVQHRWISWRQGIVRVLHAVPVVGRRSLTWLLTRSRNEYGIAVGVILYYLFVRVMHTVLDAGPMVLILTALIAIFTIGLGDNNNDTENGVLSAYSVFNRGLERMLGTVDADDLLAQHLGGAAGVLVGGGAGGGMGLGGGAHRLRDIDEADDEEEEDQDQAEDSDNDDLPRNAGAENNNGGTGGNVARRSGKKARRRDLQQRRELRRQREAALAMGFGQNDEDDQIALQRLIEDQIRAERAAERRDD